MSTPIPGLCSQFIATDETVQVTTGTLQALSTAHYYYFVSDLTAASDGQDLLRAIAALLNASLAGTVWTVELAKFGNLYKVQISHNNVASRTVTFSSALAANLGFSSASFAVAPGVFVVAAAPSVWWWTPDMPVSLTGPQQFDPAISYGVPESAGASQRAPDGTVAYVQNGVLYSATYIFNGVEFYYKARPQSGHLNEDLETWWKNGPAQGRRLLWWRDRDNAILNPTPLFGAATPFSYIEYAPQETLRGTYPAVATVPPRLTLFDVMLDLWVTEHGETPLSLL